jgi:hypothetical protein
MEKSVLTLLRSAAELERMARDLEADGRISKPDVARQILLDTAVLVRDAVKEFEARDEAW